jgi:hypothetical protein
MSQLYIAIQDKYKPRPDHPHYIENVYGNINGKLLSGKRYIPCLHSYKNWKRKKWISRI